MSEVLWTVLFHWLVTVCVVFPWLYISHHQSETSDSTQLPQCGHRKNPGSEHGSKECTSAHGEAAHRVCSSGIGITWRSWAIPRLACVRNLALPVYSWEGLIPSLGVRCLCEPVATCPFMPTVLFPFFSSRGGAIFFLDHMPCFQEKIQSFSERLALLNVLLSRAILARQTVSWLATHCLKHSDSS